MRTALLTMICLGLTGCVSGSPWFPGMTGMYGRPVGPPPGADGQPVSAAEVAREERTCAPISVTLGMPGCQHADADKIYRHNVAITTGGELDTLNYGQHAMAAGANGQPYVPAY